MGDRKVVKQHQVTLFPFVPVGCDCCPCFGMHTELVQQLVFSTVADSRGSHLRFCFAALSLSLALPNEACEFAKDDAGLLGPRMRENERVLDLLLPVANTSNQPLPFGTPLQDARSERPQCYKSSWGRHSGHLLGIE